MAKIKNGGNLSLCKGAWLILIVCLLVLKMLTTIKMLSDQQQTISNNRHYIMTLSGLSATLILSLSLSLSASILFVFLLHPTGQGRWPLPRAGVCPEFLPTREFFPAAVAYACFGGFCWFLFLWKRFEMSVDVIKRFTNKDWLIDWLIVEISDEF